MAVVKKEKEMLEIRADAKSDQKLYEQIATLQNQLRDFEIEKVKNSFEFDRLKVFEVESASLKQQLQDMGLGGGMGPRASISSNMSNQETAGL